MENLQLACWGTTSAAPALPTNSFELCSHAADLIGSKIFIFGGMTSDDVLCSQLWTLSTSTMTFSSPRVTGPRPSARMAHTLTAVEDELLLVCGQGAAGALNDAHLYSSTRFVCSYGCGG